jgi:hypothetical protein
MVKRFKLFAGIALFVKSLMLTTVIIILSVQKKSIPKAIFLVLAATSVTSALLLISYKRDEARQRKLREMDAFYDYDYELAYNGMDEDNELGFEEDAKLIPDIDD